MDAWQFMEAVTHRGYYAKISAAAAQRPEQFFIILWIGGSDTAVGQDTLRGVHIVKRKPETPDQRSIAAANASPAIPSPQVEPATAATPSGSVTAATSE